MGRRSTLSRMPQDLQDVFHRLVRAGHTIAEITDKLNELDAQVSQSAVGREVKKSREELTRYREAQEIAGTWVTELNEKPGGDVGALLTEMLKLIALDTLRDVRDARDNPDAKRLKPADLMFLGKTLQSLESTSKGGLERREKIERKVLERQAKAAEKTARAQGMSNEQWAAIRAKFLGIDDEARE